MASDPFTFTGYLRYFHTLREDKEEKEFLPFNDWSIGLGWLRRMMECRGINTHRDAWGSILLPREVFLGAFIRGCKQSHAKTYCPAQCARPFGIVQGIPCPYIGEVTVPLYERES